MTIKRKQQNFCSFTEFIYFEMDYVNNIPLMQRRQSRGPGNCSHLQDQLTVIYS